MKTLIIRKTFSLMHCKSLTGIVFRKRVQDLYFYNHQKTFSVFQCVRDGERFPKDHERKVQYFAHEIYNGSNGHIIFSYNLNNICQSGFPFQN